jgi:hypothetical protein
MISHLSPLAGLALLLAGAGAAAQSMPIVYPAAGQSAAQQARDEGECRVWAQERSGFAWGPTAPGPVATGQVAGGAAAGAAIGSVGGAIGGRAGRGAAIGAGVGAAAGLVRRGARAQESRADRGQQAADWDRQMAELNRAFATCMRGRGYSVS